MLVCRQKQVGISIVYIKLSTIPTANYYLSALKLSATKVLGYKFKRKTDAKHAMSMSSSHKCVVPRQ